MAQLLVRKIDQSLVSLLKQRASHRGRSAEEEHRLILREALAGISSELGEMSLEQYLVAEPMENLELDLPKRQLSSERKIDILQIDLAIAHRWGLLNCRNPLPYIDGFLAATAIEHGLTLATRNTKDIQSTGVSFVNPFDF